jgi:hypothetical protein
VSEISCFPPLLKKVVLEIKLAALENPLRAGMEKLTVGDVGKVTTVNHCSLNAELGFHFLGVPFFTLTKKRQENFWTHFCIVCCFVH